MLADALWYARREGATHVLDLATLTGAMELALGDLYAGFFANDDEWRDRIVAAGERSGDLVWPFPLHARYRRYVDSALRRHEERLDAAPGLARARGQVPRRSSPATGRGRTSTWPGPGFLERSRGDYYRVPGGTGLRRPAARRARVGSRMNYELTDEQELLRRTVREFAESRVAPVAEELDREERFPYELVAEMAELGLMGIPIPEEYGGAGADTVSYAIAIEELTRIDSSVAITVAAHTSLGTMPIYLYGDDEQKQEWLPQLASGEKLAAFGLTEPNAGSDAGATRTRAELRDGKWVVNGSKIFITNAGTDITACVTITARHRRRRDLEHHRPERHAGLRDLGADAQARLARVRHARALVQGLRGARGQPARRRAARASSQFMEILDGGRISVAAMGVGLAQGAYDLAFAYAKEREQFGRPIAKFQAVQFALADMATEIEAGRQLVYRAAWLKDQGKDFALAAAQAKLYTGLLSNRAANAALQIHGGYGFMEEYAISRLYRDQKILEIGEGTNEVQRMVIGKLLGL